MRYLAEPRHGAGFDARTTMYPTTMDVYTDYGEYNNVGDLYGTTYGVVVRGKVELGKSTASGREIYTLRDGSYFSFPNSFSMKLMHGQAVEPDFTPCVVLITRLGFLGQTVIGRMESQGRSPFADGCGDTLLVYPPRIGDPTLAHIHFPGNILRDEHSHSSICMGVVMSGEGLVWRGKRGSKHDIFPFMDQAVTSGLEWIAGGYAAWDAHRRGGTGDVACIEWQGPGGDNAMSSFDGAWPEFRDIVMLHHIKPGSVFMLEESEIHSFATIPDTTMDIIGYFPVSGNNN